jgi:hypothetical protein
MIRIDIEFKAKCYSVELFVSEEKVFF